MAKLLLPNLYLITYDCTGAWQCVGLHRNGGTKSFSDSNHERGPAGLRIKFHPRKQEVQRQFDSEAEAVAWAAQRASEYSTVEG